MIDRDHPLAQAARENDAEADGGKDILAIAGETFPIALSGKENGELTMLTAMYIDGITIGWRGQDIRSAS